MFTNKYIRKLIIPLIIEQTLSVTIGMADIMMVSSAGEAAVSGVSLVDIINMLLLNVFTALATGGAVVVAHYLGSRQKKKACEAAGQLLLVNLVVSIILMVIVVVFCRFILDVLYGQVSTQIMNNAVTYLTITAISYPFIAIYNSGAALFRTMGNSKISMLTALLMNVVNVTLNAVFVFIFDMGVAGIAIASLISRIVSCIVMLILIRNNNNDVYIEKYTRIRPEFKIAKKILHIGVPTGFESSFFQLGRVILASMISTFGIIQTTANGVANTLDYFGCIPAQAIGFAMITVVGQCIGAMEHEQATYYTKKLLKLAYIFSGILHVIIIIALPLLLKIYNLSDDTFKLTYLLVVMHEVLSIPFWPASFTLPQALRAAGDVKFTMSTAIVSMLVMRIGMSFVLGIGFDMGITGVWIAMIADWIFRATFFVFRFARGKWKNLTI